MNDYFDHVERDLRAAVARRAHLPWYARLGTPRLRALSIVLAAVVLAGPAYAAVSLITSGSSVPAQGPTTPRAFNGIALHGGSRMLSLRTPDPSGGLPWGMRTVATTRGLVCVQVGRVALGTIGALGRDDAFSDDGRFHPFSPDYQSGPPSCSMPDGRGRVFLNVAEYGVPTSGIVPFGGRQGGCLPPRPAMPEARRGRLRRVPLCPARDLRNVFYGLLGPDAVSISYTAPNGESITRMTSGGDGAYLLVFPGGVSAQNGSGSYDAGLFPGPITAVHYRDGHTCRLAPAGSRSSAGGRECAPVGSIARRTPVPAPSDVISHVTADVEPSRSYCEQRNGPAVVPCPGRVPAGFARMGRVRAQVLVVISFTSRVAITNGHSYYYIQMGRPPHPDPRYLTRGEHCPGGSDFGQTTSDYVRGQRVSQWFFESLGCRGTARGNVTLVSTTGPSAPAPEPAVSGQSVGREVGRFSFSVP